MSMSIKQVELYLEEVLDVDDAAAVEEGGRDGRHLQSLLVQRQRLSCCQLTCNTQTTVAPVGLVETGQEAVNNLDFLVILLRTLHC